MGCGTLTFITDRMNDNDSNAIKYTGTGGFEAFEALSGFGNVRYYQYVQEYPNGNGVISLENGRVLSFENLSYFLLTKRLLISKTTVSLYADLNVATPYEQTLRVNIMHSGVTGFERLVLAPRASYVNYTSGIYYPYFECKKNFWMQRGFNFYLEFFTPPLIGNPSPALVQFQIDAIDTYANPKSIFETECNKVPFDNITQPYP